MPLKWPLAYLPEKAGSVAFIRVTMNCSGVSRFRHSSFVRKIRSGSLAVSLVSLADLHLVPGIRRSTERVLPLDRHTRRNKARHARQQHGKTTAQ